MKIKTIAKVENFDYNKEYYTGVTLNNTKSLFRGYICCSYIEQSNGIYREGGIRFVDGVELFKYSDNHNYIREITVDKDVDVYIITYENGDTEYVADRVVSGGYYGLGLSTIKYLRKKENPNIFLNENALLLKMIYLKDINSVKYLVNEGANINVCNGTPLLLAIDTGSIDMVKLLLSLGASVKANKNILYLAIKLYKYDIADLLQSYGAECHYISTLYKIKYLLHSARKWFYGRI